MLGKMDYCHSYRLKKHKGGMGVAGEHTVRKKNKPSAHTINRENMVLRDILKHAYEKKFINTIPSIQNNYDDKSPRLDFNAEEWT